jgi:hypothetical protein
MAVPTSLIEEERLPYKVPDRQMVQLKILLGAEV